MGVVIQPREATVAVRRVLQEPLEIQVEVVALSRREVRPPSRQLRVRLGLLVQVVQVVQVAGVVEVVAVEEVISAVEEVRATIQVQRVAAAVVQVS